MAKVYDKPIILQKINELTEDWEDLYNLHASINKARDDSEYAGSGAIRSKRLLTFEIRYFKDLQDIAYNTQLYRILYNGKPFNIADYDDYMEQHITVRLKGESY